MQEGKYKEGSLWLAQKWAMIRARAPALPDLYQALRDLLSGTALGAVTAVLVSLNVSRDIPWLKRGLARFLPARVFDRPEFFDLALHVGGIAVSVLVLLAVGWLLLRIFVSWWRGAFRGILLMWWLTTAVWLFQSKGIFRLQLLWPILPLLFTLATVMAHRKEE